MNRTSRSPPFVAALHAWHRSKFGAGRVRPSRVDWSGKYTPRRCDNRGAVIERRWIASLVLRRRGLLRWGAIGLMVSWGVVSLLGLEPLHSVVSAESLSGPIVIVPAVAVLLYAYAAWRYFAIARRRASPVALALVGALILLAQAMTAVALSRTWHLSWWEWHVLRTVAFAIIALAARAEYRRTGSLVAAFRPVYRKATLAHIDRWHARAMADIAELEARGEPIDRLIADLRSDGASVEEIGVLTAAAREYAASMISSGRSCLSTWRNAS